MNQHAGDCTIYASLSNGCPTDGICTCGFSTAQARQGIMETKDVYSEERIVQMNQEQPNAGESMSFEEWWKKKHSNIPLHFLAYDTAFNAWKARDKEIESLKARFADLNVEHTDCFYELENLRAKLKVAREALEWCRMNSDASKEIIPGRTAQLALFAIDEKGNV